MAHFYFWKISWIRTSGRGTSSVCVLTSPLNDSDSCQSLRTIIYTILSKSLLESFKANILFVTLLVYKLFSFKYDIPQIGKTFGEQPASRYQYLNRLTLCSPDSAHCNLLNWISASWYIYKDAPRSA